MVAHHAAVLCVLAAAAHVAQASVFTGPIIAVLGVPADVSCDSLRTAPGDPADAGASCFTVYYTKWLEQQGARVVGIPYDADNATLQTLLDSVNGVLFTGGGLSLRPSTQYYQTASAIFQHVIAKNDAGVPLPLHGTCMGFQLLAILAANDSSVLLHNAFDSEDISLPLELTAAAKDSPLLAKAPARILAILTQQNVTNNLHHDGVAPATFTTNKRLRDFFSLLSINHDRAGRAFASTMEARRYPITGTQWHPERPQFEWTAGRGINHSADAVEAMQYFARAFVSRARDNQQAFRSDAAQALARSLSAFAMTRRSVSSDPMSGAEIAVFGK